jgi:hypothetical protein
MSFADDFDSYSPTSRPLEDPVGTRSNRSVGSFSIEQPSEESKEQPPSSFKEIFFWYVKLHSNLLLVNVVSIFAAIHFVHDLKSIVSPRDENHQSVAGAAFTLFFCSVGITNYLARRCRTTINIVWILGVVMGHVMGFALKQVYVSLVREYAPAKTSAGIGIWVSLPLLVILSFVVRLCLTYCSERYQKRRASIRVKKCWCCCGNKLKSPRSRASSELLSQRRLKMVVREASDDAYSVSIGFCIYSACYITANTSKRADSFKGIFKPEEACFAESSSNTTNKNEHESKNETAFLFVYLLMLIIFPIISDYLRKLYKLCQSKIYSSSFSNSRSSNNGRDLWYIVLCRKVLYNFINVLASSLNVSLGFGTYHIMSGAFEISVEHNEASANAILLLVGVFCFIAAIVSILTHSCCETRRTIQERTEVTVVLAGLDLPQTSSFKKIVERFREILIPSFTLMWIIFLGLSFDAFFQCFEYQLRSEVFRELHLGEVTVALIFTLFSIGSIVLIATYCGQTFANYHEEELLESVEEEKMNGNNSGVVEETVQSHEELLLDSN